MKLSEIEKMPTTISTHIGWTQNHRGHAHESVLRAYHIVGKIRELLEKNVPPAVIIELIDFMEEK